LTDNSGGGRNYDTPPVWVNDPSVEVQNSMCAESGRDYLVLGLLKSGGPNHVDYRTFSPEMLAYRRDNIDRFRVADGIDGNGTIISESPRFDCVLGDTSDSCNTGPGLKFDFRQQLAEEYLLQNSPPVVDCVETGNTAADCLANCTVATATVTTSAANGGTPCIGDYTCMPGDGACTAPAPISCDSKRFIFNTGQGCEWLDINNGEYDHKSCEEFVARSADPGGGYTCVGATDDAGARLPGSAGAGVCKNGPICTGTLPILSGKVKDGL
jgi:hypothetical protein